MVEKLKTSDSQFLAYNPASDEGGETPEESATRHAIISNPTGIPWNVGQPTHPLSASFTLLKDRGLNEPVEQGRDVIATDQ